ncbi:MAG: preprotein translocase subunit SecY [Oscillospiraceae bacterium]|nr:preprotein translocase subunit SecY [Oscillospiraceae bacterium]MDD7292702.1 preprotein translocase subunit SecY [Clostridiaceae bacterium]MDY5992273.1 preprotein translocase subunit SecY [Oscillospiraceae bacterium]
MISTFINAWKIADLRKKMLFTALIVLIFRIGAAIPVPFTNITDGITPEGSESFMNYLNMMTGEAFNYGTIFAMGVTPYINSSIIIQLLSVAIPALEKLSKEGEEGRKKMATITRYTTIALALMQSTAYFIYLRAKGFVVMDASGQLFTGISAVLQGLVVILVLTAGSAFIMWLGEQVNDKGIGNGISIILFAGIVARIPTLCVQMYGYLEVDEAYYALVPIVVVLLLAMIAYIVWMDNAERRIPVQYAKRVVGRKMYGGQSTFIPIKVNMSGVLPVIFASSILSLPATIQLFLSEDKIKGTGWETFFKMFSTDHWFYAILYFFLILFFAYFYASIQYNPVEMANNIRKNSGMIPGIRPGKPTSDYIKKILSRITLLGALLLSVVALFPNLLTIFTKLINKPMALSLGGTSLIIVVGVALETVKQLESQMMMRHYKGFLD